MPTIDPIDPISRTFLLAPEENGERHRAKVTRKVVEIIDEENGHRVEYINFILDIGNGKVEELISYNQLTCAAYAKENDLLALGGWHGFRSLDKKDKVLARAIKEIRSGKLGDPKHTCFGTSSPGTTWKPCNLTLKIKTVNGMMPLN